MSVCGRQLPRSQCAEVLSKGWQQIFMGGERNVSASLKPAAPSLRILSAHLCPLEAGRLPVTPRAPAANSPPPGPGSSRLWCSTCVSSSLAPLAGMRCAKEERLSHFCSLHPQFRFKISILLYTGLSTRSLR